MISGSTAFIAEMKDYVPELPNVTFDNALVLHDKAHELHLAFRGRGHTAGDIVLFCPQKKVIATGDLLHGWLPNFMDGYPKDWAHTLDTVAEFPFERAGGGHGGPQGREIIGRMGGYIAELTEAVDAGKRRGQTLHPAGRRDAGHAEIAWRWIRRGPAGSDEALQHRHHDHAPGTGFGRRDQGQRGGRIPTAGLSPWGRPSSSVVRQPVFLPMFWTRSSAECGADHTNRWSAPRLSAPRRNDFFVERTLSLPRRDSSRRWCCGYAAPWGGRFSLHGHRI